MHYRYGLLITGICLGLCWRPAGAIMIRHDRDDTQYRALAGDYPATAVLSIDGTGVLVGSTWVLTAAHVGVGTTRRATSVHLNGSDYNVARVYIHPKWTSMGEHDIALLELSNPVTDVRPVGLYSASDESDQMVTFVGAGDFGTGESGPVDTDGIMRGATNRVDSVDAWWVYFKFDSGASATEFEGISGPGDSGGPAFVRRDGDLFTLGVSSMGLGTGEGPGRYGARELYTRVSTHLEWLNATMAGANTEFAIIPDYSAGSSLKGETVAITGELSSMPDTHAGRRVAGFLKAYNSGNLDTYMTYLQESFTAEYIHSRPDSAHRSRYGRLRNDYFGDLLVLGVNHATATAVSVRCEGSLGRQAELKFKIEADESFRISGLEMYVVEFEGR